MKLLSLLAGRTVGSCKEYSDKPAEMYSLINTLTAQKHHSLLLTLTVVIPLRQFGSRHPLRCYSKITFK